MRKLLVSLILGAALVGCSGESSNKPIAQPSTVTPGATLTPPSDPAVADPAMEDSTIQPSVEAGAIGIGKVAEP